MKENGTIFCKKSSSSFDTNMFCEDNYQKQYNFLQIQQEGISYVHIYIYWKKKFHKYEQTMGFYCTTVLQNLDLCLDSDTTLIESRWIPAALVEIVSPGLSRTFLYGKDPSQVSTTYTTL